MHILILPSFYRTEKEPLRGLFFRTQATALQKSGAKVGTIYYNDEDSRHITLKRLKNNHFQYIWNYEDNIAELTQLGWNTAPKRALGLKCLLLLGERLFRQYVALEGRPDILHAHCTIWGGVLAHHLSKKFGIPYFITEHSSAFLQNSFSPWQAKLIAATLPQATGLMAVSGALRVAMSPYSGGQKIEIMPNFVDTAFFDRPRVTTDKFRILALGNLNHNKGFDTLIEAFDLAFGKDDSAEMTIGGKGELHDELISMVKERALDEHITLSGMLTREQVAQAMSSHQLFVSSSRVETFGVVLVEALAAGMAVVATRSGAPQEFITSEQGLLVEVDKPQEMAQAMMAMRGKDIPEGELRKYAKERFDSAILAQKLIELYNINAIKQSKI
ncbi:MAG: glycosyltransferase [Mucinivorans sp.]